MAGSEFRLQEGNFLMFEKETTPNPKPTHAGCFELLKQITEMITEQTVFLEKKTNNTERHNNSIPTESDQGFTWASILCY